MVMVVVVVDDDGVGCPSQASGYVVSIRVISV